MKILSDLDVSGKRVFLRADLDVNVEQLTVHSSRFTEATRLENLKPTVEYLLEHGAQQIFIAGHIDRPREPDPELSTSHLEAPLEAVLRRSVTYKRDFNLDDGMLSSMAQIILFENLRFWPGEIGNDLEFAKQLARLADIYVNDAFAASHREHASVVGVPALLPHVAGLHLEEEVRGLTKLIENPQRPFVAIVGGAKIETKAPVVANLAKIADWVLVGGEIAKQLTIDNLQLTTDNFLSVIARSEATKQSKAKIATSSQDSTRNDNNKSHVMVATLDNNGKDIDQASIDKFKSVIRTAKTVVWNGPMGVFEEGFERGTLAVAEAILASGAYTVVGGGETTQFLEKAGLLGKFGFVSSGGGAMLEFLAGKELPGIKALE